MSARRPPGASSASTLSFVDPSALRTGAATTLQTEAKRTGSVSAGVAVGSATTIQVTNDASVVSVRNASSSGYTPGGIGASKFGSVSGTL